MSKNNKNKNNLTKAITTKTVNKTNKTNKIKIEIPEEYEDEINLYLQNLTINKNKVKSQDISSSSNLNKNTYEVEQICDHVIKNNIWYFSVLFKGSKTPELIADSDCECEKLISEYLATKMINTIYCFCRVSSLSQTGENHVSLDAQETELINQCVSYNKNNKRIKVVKIAASAYKNIPVHLQIIGESARAGDEIVIYRVDRFSRNIVKYLSWIEELDNKHVEITSFIDKLVYSKNKLEFIQKIVDANKESKLISDRIKMSITARKQRGDQSVGKLPYGKKYKRLINCSSSSSSSNNSSGSSTSRLEVIDDLQAVTVINKVKAMNKFSNKTIADKLNKEGTYKNNRRWTPAMVRYIKDRC